MSQATVYLSSNCKVSSWLACMLAFIFVGQRHIVLQCLLQDFILFFSMDIITTLLHGRWKPTCYEGEPAYPGTEEVVNLNKIAQNAMCFEA